MTVALKYTNKRGKEVALFLTPHARQRFVQRWRCVNPDLPLDHDGADREIAELFARASRVTNLSYKERKRMDQHGQDTLLFRIDEFTFVVQAATVVTIEISDRDLRHWN